MYTYSFSAMKSRRQAAILELIDREPLHSQERLRRRLRQRGFDATQATISRDISDLGLVKRAAQYQRVIESAALTHEPHRIAFYLYDLASDFHALWNRGNDDPSRRFLVENNPQLSRARLELALGIAQIIRSGLGLMGVAATEEMR